MADVEHAGALFDYSAANMRDRIWLRSVTNALEADNCRGLVAWSEAAARSIASTLGTEVASKTSIVYATCGQGTRSLPPPTSSPLILFVGRGFWGKGGAWLLLALARLRSRSWRAVIWSDVTASDLRGLPDLDQVEFLSSDFTRVKPFEHLLAEASIFCLPTMSDTYGYVIVEAMARGIPVVAARTRAGPAELVKHTQTGLLVDPPTQIFGADDRYRCSYDEFVKELKSTDMDASAADLADALDALLANRSRRAELGEQAYQQFSPGGWLSLDVRAEAMADVYSGMLGR